MTSEIRSNTSLEHRPEEPGVAKRFNDYERSAAVRQLRVFLHLAWLLPLTAFGIAAGFLYQQAFEDAQRAVDHGSRVAQEHALKLFETNAMVLQRILDMLGDSSDEQVLARGEELHARLKRMAAELPQVQGLFINGADARAMANSLVYPPPRNIDYSDREFYKVHRAGSEPVFFSEQLTSRISGEPFFDMSRRRVRTDGSFAGSVHVSLKPGYLTDFYAEMAKSDPRLRFAVFRANGQFLARWPAESTAAARVDEATLREVAASGDVLATRGPWSTDGSERLRMFRRLSPYPLWTAASIGIAEVRAGWLARVGWLALLTLVVSLTLLSMVRLALQRTRREYDSAQQLVEETALRQRTELALLKAQKLEALGRLTGGVAHDFNNLLMVINNNLFVHRARHAGLTDSGQLAAIERAIASGTKLTRQLLSFSRRQALVPELVDLKERLPAIVELLASVVGKAIELDVRVEDGAVIRVDAAELELALINLALNAKDAMPDGGRLGLTARRLDDREAGLTGPNVVIEIVDTGSGIAPELLGRVFEPFFTTKTVGQGTGLGLSQVQALCAAAGGHVLIESDLGRGTRVRLVFPLDGGEPAVAAKPPRKRSIDGLEWHLLLVEDNDAVAKTSAAVLESMGCKVEHVSDAAAALTRLADAQRRFDVVVSDIEMPGELDGIELAEQISLRYPETPVVLMTGYASRLREAEDRKFNVLPKPVDPVVLVDAIASALKSSGEEAPRAA